ncbi:hypothetical protein DICPUDRAFT_84989 [Dictyostelium purpureum]|uniref:Uncharacterized protein n=1 Tax=Dictyostelium purpureum TaxID=5786 RepID=F1A4C4_DICPU|nr:uncharacterized protein DICPUDRAFT_84989 [Dictyostelium purpureum]EGC28956.1 hypothetical protein DICPUDRAFT_84989 [Dictyostelium purpureum]|eukprot:XP_003294515.1 hypothetical protein DICPUDRAFT_84989 [Dictyostelium purpureum]
MILNKERYFSQVKNLLDNSKHYIPHLSHQKLLLFNDTIYYYECLVKAHNNNYNNNNFSITQSLLTINNFSYELKKYVNTIIIFLKCKILKRDYVIDILSKVFGNKFAKILIDSIDRVLGISIQPRVTKNSAYNMIQRKTNEICAFSLSNKIDCVSAFYLNYKNK